MKRYRFAVNAALYFDVEAVDEQQARDRAAGALRMATGLDVPAMGPHAEVHPDPDAALDLEEEDEVLR